VDPFPGQEFAGKVAMVGSVVNAASRTVPVEAEFANRDGRLRPGMFARVELAAEPGGSR
jgi:multidrug efflux pump subunit AcrA (membrane-fusion protein)